MADLNPQYQSSRDTINARLGAIPSETDATIASADGALADANSSILNSARGRGLGFSGIPVSEQAKYAAGTYAPAVLNAKVAGANKELDLRAALNTIDQNQRTQAQSIYDTGVAQDLAERQFQEQIREYNASAAASAAANSGGSYSFGGGTSASSDPSSFFGGSAAMTQRANDKGFNFVNSNGQAISAAAYAKQMGIPFRTLLTQMANAGDSGAKTALGFVGNDYGYDRTKVGTNTAYVNLLKALGINATATKAAATTTAKKTATPANSQSVIANLSFPGVR